jgi:hypothetical protein
MAIVSKTSSSPDTITLIVGENLSQYDYVFVAHPTAGYTFLDGSVAGRAYKARKDIRARGANAKCVGFATAAANAGDPVVVKTKGYLAGQSGLTAGRVYQPSTTPGAIELFDGLKQYHPNIVGVAISTTELIIYDQIWRQRGRGYLVGGHVSVQSALVETFSFSNLTSVNVPSLSAARKWPATGSSSIKAYTGGGSPNNDGSSPSAIIFYMPYSSDTNATGTNITVARCQLGSSYSTTKNYYAGGIPLSGVLDGITFSSEVCASVTTLSQSRSGLSSSQSALKMYNFGGSTGSLVTTIDSLTFSTESGAAISAVLSSARFLVATCASNTKSYVGGGHSNTAGTTQINNVDALTFSNETMGAVTTFTNIARGQLAGMASFTKAYFPGGYQGSAAQSLSDELPFSTETCAVSLTLLSIKCSCGSTQS